MGGMGTHSVACYAKLNLALSVGKPDANGMHPVCSWMVKIDYADTLQRVERESDAFPMVIKWAEDAFHKSEIDWAVENDLAYQAIKFGAGRLGRSVNDFGVWELNKRVPVGAGLGGGSADAAGMLSYLGKHGLSSEDQHDIAEQLGSDVSFFLDEPDGEVRSSAIISGFGEIVEPVPLKQRLHFTLILPALHCHTGRVYGHFDELYPEAELRSEEVRALARSNTLSDEMLFNDLAEQAFVEQPALRALRDQCAEILGRGVHVTGSGAALFALAESESHAQEQATRVMSELGVPALAVKTL